MTNKHDLVRVKLNQRVKYLRQRSFYSKVIVGTHRHTPQIDCVTWTTKWSVEAEDSLAQLQFSTITYGQFRVPKVIPLWCTFQNLVINKTSETVQFETYGFKLGRYRVLALKRHMTRCPEEFHVNDATSGILRGLYTAPLFEKFWKIIKIDRF